ncbi:hypothetical protein JW707_01245 [Candidatus Woesearchaeota archaeon]|nr:hypothetical protein [Candidatus Woesearchaeota archaeon]
MGAAKLALIFALLILSAGAASSLTFDSQVMKYDIVGSRVFVQAVFNFTQKTSGSVVLPVPSDAETIEIYLDGEKSDISANGIVSMENPTKEIRLSYITGEYVDKSSFLLNLPLEHETNYLKVAVVLPEEAVLRKPIKEGSGSIYPKPDKSGTDGKSLIFVWERESLSQGGEFSAFVMYRQKTNYLPLVVVLLAVIVVLAYFGFYKKPKKTRSRIVVQRARKDTKEKEGILEHLKDDEQQIMRVLRQRDNQCEQGTLRVVTGFSKAHLSRLIMELEARKVVYKEKRGKKNVVFLK